MSMLREHPPLLAVLFSTAVLTLPAGAAGAVTGGASPTPGAAGPSLRAGAEALAGGRHVLTGAVAREQAGGPVAIELLDPDRGWTSVARARARPDGSFRASWLPADPGRVRLRAKPTGVTVAAAAASGPELRVLVHRPAVATWYGPGLYGRRTACGRRLRPSTLGVAHRTLPCGTRVSFLHRGRTITVAVIDRGPFRAGTTWDLTAATARWP